MDRQFIILILAILFIFIYFKYNNQENITSDSGKTLSDEAVQNIASVYNTQNMTVTNLTTTNQANIKDAKISNNLNVSGSITGNVTGNVTGNANINTLSSDVSGNSINVKSQLLYDQSIRPSTLTVSVGNYKGPIYDVNGKTFPIDKYTIKQISGSSTIGVRNNKWWICPYPHWNIWTQSVFEIIPIPLNQYYNNYSNSSVIVVDGNYVSSNYPNGTGWATVPLNHLNNSYYSFDGTNKYTHTQPITTES
jgi:hypothetical protein